MFRIGCLIWLLFFIIFSVGIVSNCISSCINPSNSDPPNNSIESDNLTTEQSENITNLRNPTYDEMLWFLHSDNTDKRIYDYNGMVCSHFADLLQSNATKAQIRCGRVSVRFDGQYYGHACNVFDTVDEGLVFIDCTGITDNEPNTNCDKMIEKFESGKLYTLKSLDYTCLKEYKELSKKLAGVSYGYIDKARPMRLRGMSNKEYEQSIAAYNNRSAIEAKIDNIRSKWGQEYQPLWAPMGIVSFYSIRWEL
jgi:hypothetical protein